MGGVYKVKYVKEQEEFVKSELSIIGDIDEEYSTEDTLKYICDLDKSLIEDLDGVLEVTEFESKDSFIFFCEDLNSRDWLK